MIQISLAETVYGFRLFLLFTTLGCLIMSDEIKAQIVSPQVSGNDVTFRLKAPKASKVFVVGVEGQKKNPAVQGRTRQLGHHAQIVATGAV